MFEIRFFDQQQEFTIVQKNLPHWVQAGTVTFITWRAADSLPDEVQSRVTQEREQILRAYGLDPRRDWKAAVSRLPAVKRGRLHWALFQVWDNALDLGHGACVLKAPALSEIVGDSLLHFDGQRYFLTDFVVMPNHVHLLATFPSEEALFEQCTSWKRYSARQINQRLDQSGELWQVEQFDHLVRSAEQFEHYRQYIANNPKRARLRIGEYRHYSKHL
jgi:putative transposase